MGRYRVILEGVFDDSLDIIGVTEQIGMRLENMGDLRIVKIFNLLDGCLICRHGVPIEGSYYKRVMCRSRGQEHERCPTDSCMRFVRLDVMDKQVLHDSALAAEYGRRIEIFNRLVRKDE